MVSISLCPSPHHLSMSIHPKSMLRLVHEPLLRPSMHSLVLATADLIVQRLRVALARVGLRAACDLVGAASDGLLGLVEGGLGRVGSLSVGLVGEVDGGEAERTSFSPALVWKSLRNASDMIVVGGVGWLVGWFGG
jgi:hypothetical protein